MSKFDSNNPFKGYFEDTGEQIAEIVIPSNQVKIERLRKYLNGQMEKDNIPIKFVVEKNEPFQALFLGDDKYTYYISFHETAVSSFAIDASRMTKITRFKGRDMETFYLHHVKTNVNGLKNNWHIEKPGLIRIKCDQIQHQVFNNNKTNDLAVFYQEEEEDPNYLFYEFHAAPYIPLSNSSFDNISLSIRDYNNDLLNLPSGISSVAKLKIKRMSPSEFFHVRICSDNMDNNNFSVTLPQEFNLDSRWKVALTSISHPSILPLPQEYHKRTISMYTATEGIRVLTLENTFLTIEELVSIIDKFMSPNHIKRDNGRLTFTKYSRFGFDKTHVGLTLNEKSILTLPDEIAEILGFNIENYENRDDTGKVKRFDQNVVFNSKSANSFSFTFPREADIKILTPQYFMLYASIIEPCIVGSEFSKLLKIVSVYGKTDGNSKNEEFKHLEYHPLESTCVTNVTIQIRSHTGSLINFKKSEKVFLNLLFSNHKNNKETNLIDL